MKKAVIYARYSSTMQNDGSIEAQERACREYAKRNEISVIRVYADKAISGTDSKTEARAAYQTMLRDSRKHTFDLILIHKYDRVARSLSEQVNLEIRLKRENIQLIAVAQDFGNTNEAMIARAITWSMAEYYSLNLASEVRKGHREAAEKGRYNGGLPPFGYDIGPDKKYIINDFEAAYVRKIFTSVINREGFADLLRDLEAQGIRGKRGKILKYTQVYDILHNEKYTGTYLYSPEEEKERNKRRSKPNAIRIENAFPAIIDKATFEEVQKIMKERKQVGRNRQEYLCSGLVYCSCGSKMYGFTNHINGKDYQYYKCISGCGSPLVKMEAVDNAALSYLENLLSDSTQEDLAVVLQNYQGHEKDFRDGFYADLNRQIEERQQQYNNLYQKFTSTAVLPDDVIEQIGSDLHRIKAEIEELQAAEPPAGTSVPMIKEWLSSIKAAPDKKAVHLLIDRITITQQDGQPVCTIKSTLQNILEEIGCDKTQQGIIKTGLPLLFGLSRTLK